MIKDDDSSEVSPSGAMTKGVVKEFTVTGSPFKFVPAAMTVKKGDTVKITFKNSGGTHDFVIDELGVKTKTLASGAEETVQFVASKVGTFEYYCSVGNHRAMGMVGKITITE
jgi:plastocyanin